MRFFHSWRKVPEAYQNAVIAVGNFDGFHLGHHAVVEKAVEVGKEMNRPVMLMTFEPHPSAFFRPGGRTFRITPIRAKVRAICTLPIDGFFVFPFNRAFADMTAKQFVDNVLIGGLHAAALVVGEDYGFGHNREGDVEYLQKNYPALPVYPVAKLRDFNGEIISSSRIRAFIRDGHVAQAAKLTGRPFEIEGYVVHGFKRGRVIGFPTINIEPHDSIVPRLGVYAAKVLLDGEWKPALANIGTRPTVDGEGILLEAHILNYNGDLYGKRLRVQLTEFIRPEQKFASLIELKRQIEQDMNQIKRILE